MAVPSLLDSQTSEGSAVIPVPDAEWAGDQSPEVRVPQQVLEVLTQEGCPFRGVGITAER